MGQGDSQPSQDGSNPKKSKQTKPNKQKDNSEKEMKQGGNYFCGTNRQDRQIDKKRVKSKSVFYTYFLVTEKAQKINTDYESILNEGSKR